MLQSQGKQAEAIEHSSEGGAGAADGTSGDACGWLRVCVKPVE